MKMRSIALFCMFIFTGNFAFAEGSSTPVRIAYNDLSKLIREKNEKVKAAQIAASAANIRTGFLTRSFLPSLALKTGSESAQLGVNSAQQRDFWGAEAQLNIYRGGRDKIEEKIRESKSNAMKAESVREFQSELRDARKTYLQLIAIGKTLNEMNEVLKNNSENIKAARRRVGAGVSTTADGVQFELENTLLNQQLKKLTLEKDLLQNKLSVAIAADNHKNLVIDEDFSHPPEVATAEVDLSNTKNPELEVLKFEENIYSLKKEQAANWWLPSVDLYSVYRRPSFLESESRSLSRENEWVTGVQASFNLGQGLEDRIATQSQELEAKATSLRLSYSFRKATALKHELVHDLNLIHELIHDAEKDIEKASDFLKLTKAEYNRGVKNGPDLLEAFAKFYEFRNRNIELYRTYHETQAEISYQTGKDELE